MAAGEAAKEQAQAERETARSAAASALADEVARRATSAKPMLHGDAVDLLMEHGLSRKAARNVIAAHDGGQWVRETVTTEQGRPKVLLPPIKHEATAETSPLLAPYKQRDFAEGVSAGRVNVERQKHQTTGPAKTAAIMAGGIAHPQSMVHVSSYAATSSRAACTAATMRAASAFCRACVSGIASGASTIR